MSKTILKFYRRKSDLPKTNAIDDLFEREDIKITFHHKEKTETMILFYDVPNGNLKHGENKFVAIEMSETLFLQFDDPLKHVKSFYQEDDIQYQ